MPTYEFICKDCGEKTYTFASIKEKEKGLKITCPKCGSSKVSQTFTSFTVLGPKTGSSGCGPGSGSGCCG